MNNHNDPPRIMTEQAIGTAITIAIVISLLILAAIAAGISIASSGSQPEPAPPAWHTTPPAGNRCTVSNPCIIKLYFENIPNE